MLRSRTQVLFSYLPHAVFVHESGLIAQSAVIRGNQLTEVNRPVLLAEIDAYLQAWNDDDLLGLPRPSRVDQTEFRILTPEVLSWDLWPLVFECSRERCARITTYRAARDIAQSPCCPTCQGPLRQLRYFSAHDCGHIKEMYVPRCANGHEYADVYFQDTGTFRTAVFRCRGCGGAPIRRTAQSPCTCAREPDDTRSMMRAFTVRDTRTYHPHSISLINLQSTTFNQLQAHPARGDIAVASYLGLLGDDNRIRDGLAEADRAPSGSVMTTEEWIEREAEFRTMGLSDDQIADIRRAIGPRDAGLAALAGIEPVVLALGRERTLVERAAIFDASELRRITLADAHRGMLDRGEPTAAAAVDAAQRQAEGLGIEDISVTWAFPIAVAAFGYTRVASKRGEGRLRGFARQGAYEGRIPIFAVATETEAIILTLSARQVLRWLVEAGIYAGSEAVDEQAARQEVLGIFARQEADPAPAEALTVLVHTMSHILLRALDDGQVGFAEASLAEWIVPETLTFALYANNLKSYTLGALWTLLNNRSLQWLERTADSVWRCENDPLCYQRSPRACERCLFLTFGCQRFNDQLDRQLLSDFWRRA